MHGETTKRPQKFLISQTFPKAFLDFSSIQKLPNYSQNCYNLLRAFHSSVTKGLGYAVSKTNKEREALAPNFSQTSTRDYLVLDLLLELDVRVLHGVGTADLALNVVQHHLAAGAPATRQRSRAK